MTSSAHRDRAAGAGSAQAGGSGLPVHLITEGNVGRAALKGSISRGVLWRESRRAFLNFSADLYCSGAQEQSCATPGGARSLPGKCHWWQPSTTVGRFTPAWEDDNTNGDAKRCMNATGHHCFQSDRWVPTAAGYRRFDAAASSRCMRGKRVLIVGDSTTRDTFHVLMAVAGQPIWQNRDLRGKVWNDSAWQPKLPFATKAMDKYGVCNGDQTSNPPHACVRDVVFNQSSVLGSYLSPANSSLRATRRATRVSYQYVMSNETWEMDLMRGLMRKHDHKYDVALVQCPMWTSFMPQSYDRSAAKTARHKIQRRDSYEQIGLHCRDIIDVIRQHSPHVSVLMLGISALPRGRTSKNIYEDEPKLFASIHEALGISCSPTAEGGYTLSSRAQVVPVDRYNIWKQRTRDQIHPFFNGQFALIQLLFNHICPRGQPAAQDG